MAQEVSIIIKAIDQATKTIGGIWKWFSSLSDKIKSHESTFKGMAIAGGVAFGAISLAIGKSISSAKESQQVTAQLNAVLESTGHSAGLSADEITRHASALQKTLWIADEVTGAGQNMLLTFTNIGKNVFPQATETMLDMATAMNWGATPSAEQLKGTAIQLGKALNDPIAGISALSRVGVSFTEQQKSTIESMVQMGDVAGAQKLILAELAKEFGGSAQASAETFDGSMRKLKLTIDDVFEGVWLALVPAIQKLTESITPLVEKLSVWVAENPKLATNIVLATTAVAWLVAGIGSLGLVLPAIMTWLTALWAVIGAIGWPITLVVAWVALLGTAWATNFWQIQDKTKVAFQFISDVFKAFVDLFHGDFQLFSEWLMIAFFNLFENIKNLFPGVYDGFVNLWEKVESITAKILARVVVFVLDKLATVRQTLQSIKDTFAEIASFWKANTQTFNGKTDQPAKNADGWVAMSGSPRIVGEYWPEMFVPDRSGTIMNQRQLASSGLSGGGITINFGGVSISNEWDENRLVDKIKTALIRENTLYNKWFA